jgi:spore maturation protein CgeB
VLLTVHSCVLTWWRAVHGCDAPPSWASYRRLVEVALTRADQVVTPTRALLRDLEAVYGPLPEAQVIADGRGMRGVYDPCANREALMVTAGRLWDEAKNAAQVARAAPAIDGRVVMIGAGAAAPSTSASVESVGELAEAQVVQWLSRAAVFAEPARYEPFGLAALEAALCGCALVLGDIPSLREVWGDAAAYVSPDDARALASAINSLLGHPPRGCRAPRPGTGGALRARGHGRALHRVVRAADANRGGRMRFKLFCHSLVSDWNHGNAHFLRGVARELCRAGHRIDVLEPRDAWSRAHLLKDAGPQAVEEFHRVFPELDVRAYDPAQPRLEEELADADVVLVHDWNPPALIAAIGEHHRRHPDYGLLFYDAHHRAATAPEQLQAFDLSAYDAVLAFGAVIRDLYLEHGWAQRAFVWHEAADTELFVPGNGRPRDADLVWIGNWGDGERTRELQEYLLEPARRLGLHGHVHGVRYPVQARRAVAGAGLSYEGWLPNYRAPEAFARHRVTVHVPRRAYARRIPGVPTIRVFEALACAIPLVSAPWEDSEGLFRPGKDYLLAHDGDEMAEHLRALLADPQAAAALAANGLETVRRRHTCAHRVDELLTMVGEL